MHHPSRVKDFKTFSIDDKKFSQVVLTIHRDRNRYLNKGQKDYKFQMYKKVNPPIEGLKFDFVRRSNLY